MLNTRPVVVERGPLVQGMQLSAKIGVLPRLQRNASVRTGKQMGLAVPKAASRASPRTLSAGHARLVRISTGRPRLHAGG